MQIEIGTSSTVDANYYYRPWLLNFTRDFVLLLSLLSSSSSRPQVVQLGLQVVPSSANAVNVSFLYTDVNKYPSASDVLATFSVPWKIRKYLRLSLRVTRHDVKLFGRCVEPQTVSVTRNPAELLFDSASTLYLGQAGPLIKGPFDVSATRS